MAINGRGVQSAAIVLLSLILLLLPLGVYFFSKRTVPIPSSNTIAPAPAHPFSSGTRDRSIVRTILTTVIYYWMYGRVISVDSIASDGVHITFILEGDPYGTRLPVVITPEKETYRLFEYTPEIGRNIVHTLVDADTLRTKALESGALVELRLPFLSLNKAEIETMAALDAARSGNWQVLPTQTTLYAQTVGVVVAERK